MFFVLEGDVLQEKERLDGSREVFVRKAGYWVSTFAYNATPCCACFEVYRV